MKILTNTQSIQVGGIAQSITSFLQFIEKSKDDDISVIGVDIIRHYLASEKSISKREVNKQITVITQSVLCKEIHNVLLRIKSLKELEEEYRNIIEVFRKIILEEKPDLIVLNGTYFIPWCLYLAAKSFNIPILLHYHGIITKETETWDAHSHLLMKKMEQTFDNSRLQYIFPSQLAKKVVEEQVFGHKISHGAILPNSISAHFFEVNTKGKPKNIGIVNRWTAVKNTNFVMGLAKYNQDNQSFFKINVVTDIKGIMKQDKKRLRSVMLHSAMSSLKLGKFYGDMGTILCPSTFESYGNVPQEAVASGTPALVGNNMGIAEVFRKVGLGDYVIDFSSVGDVHEKAKEVGRHKVKNNIRKAMKNELSSDNVNARLLNIYKQTAN